MKEHQHFEIKIGVGALPVTFGMTPDEVVQALGDADGVGKNFQKNRIDYRSFMNIGYSLDGGFVCHIGFGRQMSEVYFEGINIFQSDEKTVIKKLCEYDASPYESLGQVAFLKLGIILTGFHDGEVENKAFVITNDMHEWEGDLDKLMPYLLMP